MMRLTCHGVVLSSSLRLRPEGSKVEGRSRARLSAICVAVVVVGSACSAPCMAAAGGVNDAWLSELSLDELKRTSETGNYGELAERTTSAVLARLSCGRLHDLDALNDMVYVLRACAYLTAAEKLEDGDKLSKWLIEHREVSRLLFRAMAEVESPEEALKRIQELIAADEQAVRGYSNLAAAFATTEPLRHYREQPEPATMRESFAWYANPAGRFRYDLKAMPYELSRYLADTRLSIPERQWARNQYARSRNPGRAYFDLKYDIDHLTAGTPKKIAGTDYTLPELRRVGGVCIDQAYYAGEICKALGMPACIVTGRGRSGVGHAWLACFSSSGASASWDTRTGRYSSQLYYVGLSREPATGKQMLDAEMSLVGSAAMLPAQRREYADAAVVLARLARNALTEKRELDEDLLPNLAAEYEKRFDGKKANIAWTRDPKEISQSVVEDLLHQSISHNLAYRPAWAMLIELREAKELPTKQLGRFFDTLVDKTARQYPDYSCVMILRIAPTIEDEDYRRQIYQRSVGVYGWRPDLQGRILIAYGDDLLQRGNKEDALRAYQEAASKSIKAAPVMLKAAGKAEQIYVEEERTDLAIRMYQELFLRLRAENVSSQFRSQSAHFRIGQRLAELLRSVGKTDQADRVLERIGA